MDVSVTGFKGLSEPFALLVFCIKEFLHDGDLVASPEPPLLCSGLK